MENRWRTSRLKSFYHAFSGIIYNFKNEPNFTIQLVAAAIVVVMGLWFKIEKIEWLIVILAVGSVLAAEIFNTTLEKICDRFMDEHDPRVKVIKDSAAAAVLIVSLVAAVIGLIVFVPYFIAYFTK